MYIHTHTLFPFESAQTKQLIVAIKKYKTPKFVITDKSTESNPIETIPYCITSALRFCNKAKQIKTHESEILRKKNKKKEEKIQSQINNHLQRSSK